VLANAESEELEGEPLSPYVASGIETVAIFLRTLALCHSAVPSGPVENVIWRASSPDEEALIKVLLCCDKLTSLLRFVFPFVFVILLHYSLSRYFALFCTY
jgi:magnesium-transporting ATPase (P-type)